ncbi:MAG: allophanate hydrolase [Gammaproteobacteria bacterium]|nr:allophanate hydrolase [Gammaproteobacteria bacterium]
MIRLDSITWLRKRYADGRFQPQDVIETARKRALGAHEAVWIHVLDESLLSTYIDRLENLDFDTSPLWGVPFAIKDNIDLADVPTTAGCPDYAYVPERSAFVVSRLIDAGAIPIGKTNLDQFATGLTGTRSPYGAVPNAIDPTYIAGGSSSGSAVAVKNGSVSFALGTDTAGSGRIPAAFNDLIGFKPTRGWWSTKGVVPACRSLDCVSVFTNNVADASVIARVAGSFDREDPFARRIEQASFGRSRPQIGYLNPNRLPWREHSEYANLYRDFIEDLPDPSVSIDPEPFLGAGALLYEGPWIVERVVAVGDFLMNHRDAIHPISRAVIESAPKLSAVECFQAQYQLAGLRRQIELIYEEIDVLVMPTAPKHYTLAEVENDPFVTNSYLGTFSHCVNLLDLCAVAIPASATASGLPFGVTLVSKAGFDISLLQVAASICDDEPIESFASLGGEMRLAVCGAHMTGQPLNHELERRGGRRIQRTRTSSKYRLYQLPDGIRPALVRSESEGAAIELEVWTLPEEELGVFIRSIERPLAIGSVELEDGDWVKGFVGDFSATDGAVEITAFGGWREFRRTSKPLIS